MLKTAAIATWRWYAQRHWAIQVSIGVLLVVFTAGPIASAFESESDEPVRTRAATSAPTSPEAQSIATTPATATPTLDPIQVLTGEAKDLCPSEFLEPCTGQYIAFATGSKPAALCVTDDDLWFFETPKTGATVGNTCAGDTDGKVKAIVGG